LIQVKDLSARSSYFVAGKRAQKQQIMKTIGKILITLSLLLSAAHELRAGDEGMCLVWLGFALLSFGRGAWLRPVLFAALVFALAEWAETSMAFISFRLAAGEPWSRLAIIMAAVMLTNVSAAALLQHDALRRFYHQDTKNMWSRASAFLLTFVLLAFARDKAFAASGLEILLMDRFLPGLGMLQVFCMACLAQLATSPMLDPARSRSLRPKIWGLFSLIFFGQLALGLAGIEEMLMTGKLHFPIPALIIGGPVYRGGGFFMLILFTSTVLLVGPAWCSRLCYVGAWDDFASRKRKPLPGTLTPLLYWGRAGILLLVVGVAYRLRVSGAEVSTAIVLASVFGLLSLTVMLVVSRRLGFMAHCTALCPMGLVANLLGKVSPWRLRIHKDCTQCGACARVCRYDALQPQDLERGRPGLSCSLCGDCVSACPHSHMGISFPGLSQEKAWRVFTVLTLSLWAVFVAVARI
jgi:ferredoxin